MPVVGNVKLIILSERMMRGGQTSNASPSDSSGREKLIVRWKTCGKTKGDVTDQIKKMMAILGRNNTEGEQDFHGLFIFEFDEEGRIISHTIEHVEEGNEWEKTAKVISVTDWWLGRAWGKEEEPVLGLAMCEDDTPQASGRTKS
jgi:Mitochondrial protein up-regulated during meiosis